MYRRGGPAPGGRYRVPVTTADEERLRWDAAAELDPMGAAWSEPDVAQGIADCLDALAPIRPTLDAGGRLLDLGCGGGRLAVPLARAHPNATVVGVDVSPFMLRDAARAGLPNLELHLGDGRAVPDEVAQIDGGWSVLLFQHVDDRTMLGYLAGVHRRLRRGGVFRFQVTIGSTNVAYSHDRALPDVIEIVARSGLRARDFELALVRPGWAWVTAESPE